MSTTDYRVNTVGIGCDHLGLDLKNAMRDHMKNRGIKVVDIGAHDETPVDYPDVGAALARRLDLGKALRLGRGEAHTGGAQRESNLADALEALLGAVFLDGGFEAALKVVCALYEEEITRAESSGERRDPKTALQEGRQARGLSLPDYRVLETKEIGRAACRERV